MRWCVGSYPLGSAGQEDFRPAGQDTRGRGGGWAMMLKREMGGSVRSSPKEGDR